MAWRFVDRQGGEGWIGDDLSVDYSGEEGIVDLIETLARDVEGESTRDSTQRVVIDLYATGAVRVIERCDAETISVESPSGTVDRSAHTEGERST